MGTVCRYSLIDQLIMLGATACTSAAFRPSQLVLYFHYYYIPQL
jgi:hypothetical protein